MLIAGKGHENYQIIGDERITLDDRADRRDVFLREVPCTNTLSRTDRRLLMDSLLDLAQATGGRIMPASRIPAARDRGDRVGRH